jgi:uncharacterized membrane protein
MNTQGIVSSIVSSIVPVHVLAGMTALLFGYVALAARKGAAVHRKSGMVFVGAMLTMSLSGALMSALETGGVSVNVIAGSLTFYFVATGLLSVRSRDATSEWIDAGALLFVLTLGLLAFTTGVEASKRNAPLAAPMFVFGVVAMLAATGDIRMMRAGGIEGSARLKRHLWRMCFAMWVAAASFFWGPRGRVPEVIRIPALLPIPVLAPIAVMLYWLWRLRTRRTSRTLVSVSAPQTL